MTLPQIISDPLTLLYDLAVPAATCTLVLAGLAMRFGSGVNFAGGRFQPGKSGNPGGRPKVDLAGEIARAIFENDGPAIYAAFSKILRKCSPYAFQVLSDRSFGKLKETHQVHVSPYKDVSTEDLAAQIKRLEVQLGYRKAKEAPSEPKVLLPPVSESNFNNLAKTNR